MRNATAELHDLRLARKRKPVPIPATATRIIGAMGGSIGSTEYGITFRLRTLRRGVEMWMSIPGFSWSLSESEGVWPASFKEARKWLQAYAARFGQTFEETFPDRYPRPSGADRLLMKAGGCREAWLRSDVPALFGEAAVRCHHAGGYCMADGYCHFGDCDMEMDPQPAPSLQDSEV